MTRVLLMMSMAIALIVPAVAADTLTGKVITRTRSGVEPAVVIAFATPLGGAAPSRPVRASMLQKDKSFRPGVLVVPVGSTVEFPNQDAIFHNAFSLSSPAPFDLGLYRAGASKARVFSESGTYRVFCNIHPQMTALLAVVPSPYFALAERGVFRLDVPPGSYRLTVFSERAAAVTVDVRVGGPDAAVPDLTLDESSVVLTDHKNKYGQPYPKEAYAIK